MPPYVWREVNMRRQSPSKTDGAVVAATDRCSPPAESGRRSTWFGPQRGGRLPRSDAPLRLHHSAHALAASERPGESDCLKAVAEKW